MQAESDNHGAPPPKVSFLIGGAQKSGTTTLENWLKKHPNVATPSRREVHFFDVDSNFVCGEPNYDAYHAMFDFRRAKTIGESTPAYMYWPPVAERVARYNSSMKWIILLRDPVDRAYSHWNMIRDWGYEKLDFLSALSAESERLENVSNARQWRRYSYLDRSRYAGQIGRLWKCFGQEQTLILRSEKLWSDPGPNLSKVCELLDLPPPTDFNITEAGRRVYQSDLSPQARKLVQRMLEVDADQVAALLGWDLSDWMS